MHTAVVAAHFDETRIDIKPVPKALEDMKDNTLPAIEEAETQKIPIQKIPEGAHEQRRTRVNRRFEPPPPFRLSAECVAARLERTEQPCFALGELQVLAEPIREVVTIVINEIVLKPAGLALEQLNVLIHLDGLTATESTPKQAQQPGRIHAAVADPAVLKHDA